MASILDSKCVLVTGATSGIGRALALEIAKLPSKPKVIGCGRRQDRLDELSKAGLEGIQLDVSADRETLKSSVEDVVSKNPEVDTIILCAGIQRQFNFNKDVDLDGEHPPISPLIFSRLTIVCSHLSGIQCKLLVSCGNDYLSASSFHSTCGAPKLCQ